MNAQGKPHFLLFVITKYLWEVLANEKVFMYRNEYEVLCMMNSHLNFNLESVVLENALFLSHISEKFQFAGNRENLLSLLVQKPEYREGHRNTEMRCS